MINRLRRWLSQINKSIQAAKNDYAVILPDNSAFALMSYPLPTNHWIYGDPFMERCGEWGDYEPPPMPFRMPYNDPKRIELEKATIKAIKYGIRASTMKGKETDFDPDAMVRNILIGMFGYYTETGLSSDFWANPIDDSNTNKVEL